MTYVIFTSELAAYPNDNTRFDVIVANEQRWYLKTSNTAERQGWLIALGSSKANNKGSTSSLNTTDKSKLKLTPICEYYY